MERQLNEVKTEFKRFDNRLLKIDSLHNEIGNLEKYVDDQYEAFKEKFNNFESLAIQERESARADRVGILQETKIVHEYKKELLAYN